MKTLKRIVISAVIFLGLFVASCGEKKSAEKAEKSVEAANGELIHEDQTISASPGLDEKVEKIKEIQNQQKSAPVKEEEMSDVAGFSQYLPKDTEMFMNMRNMNGLLEAMRGSEIGKMIADLAQKEGMGIDEAMQSEGFQEFLKIAGEEVFISMGDGSAKSLKLTGDVYAIYYEMYYYMIGKMLLDMTEGGELAQNPAMVMRKVMRPVYDKLLKLDPITSPRIVVGFKVSNENDRKKYTQLIQETLAKAPKYYEDMVKELKPDSKVELFLPDETKNYGGFKGLKIDYAKLSETYFDTPETVKELEAFGISQEYMEKIFEKFKDFKITLLVGNYGDYVIIYLGDTSEGLEFVEQPSESLLANDEMNFFKEYKGKEVISMTYISKEIDEELAKVSGLMEDISLGVNRFLGETESLGDTKHIQSLLKKMAENEKHLAKIAPISRFGSVAYLEDGFKLESFHGAESGVYDLETPRKLASIAMQSDAVISSSWVAKEGSSDLAVQTLEDIVNLAYQVTKLVVEYESEDRDFIEFCDMFKMLDGQFSDDLLAIWKSLKSGAQDGLGNEGAMVMDMKGKLPRLPDVPTIILENGSVPRLAMGYDVVDRAKLSSSWDEIDAANKSIVTKIEQITNQKINYRTPELAQKEGIDFWSYQLGITSHEANLALGINDQMMFLTSSPAFVEGFVPLYDATGKRGGMDFKIRMEPIRESAKAWLKLINDRGSDISPAFDRAEFEESKTMIDEVLRVSEEIDSLDFSMRKVNGEVRSFIHLNKGD